MKVKDIMTTNVSTAEPDTTLEEIATIMRDEDIGAVPVIEGSELLGIITDRDIVIRCIAEGQHPSELCAEDILTDDVEIVRPDSDVDEAAELMSRRQIRRLPVVDNGRLVGMVSIGDIAVKQGDDDVSGDALEHVSQGVKRSGSRSTSAQSQTESKPQTSGSRGSRERGSRSKQKVTSHRGREERSHESRVVPIRAEAKTAKKRHKAS